MDEVGGTPRMPWETGSAGSSDEATDANLFTGLKLGLDDVEETQDTTEDGPEEELEESDSDDLEDEIEDEEWEDEEDEDEEPEEDEDTEDLYEVTVDGVPVQVTFDELLKGYSRTADYTRKTMATAEERKAAQQMAAEAAQARAQYLHELQRVTEVIQELEGGAEPDWDQIRKDSPGKFPEMYADWQLRQRDLAALRGRQNQVQQEHYQYQMAQMEQVKQAELEKVAQAMPEWTDPEKGQATRQDLAEFAKTQYGFSDDDLSSVLDHRLILLLRDAAQGAKASAAAKGAKQRGPQPKLKPGGRQQAPAQRGKDRPQGKKQIKEARQKLARSGGHEKSAGALIGLLGLAD